MIEEKKSLIEQENAKTNIRSFRNLPEVEQLYRFVHDNGVRKEAVKLLGHVVDTIKALKKASKRKKRAKTQ